MKNWQEYKLFIIGSLCFLLLIGYLLLSDETDKEEKIAFSNEKYTTKTGTDKASALQKAYQEELEKKEEKNKFLSAADKMIGIIELEDAPIKNEEKMLMADTTILSPTTAAPAQVSQEKKARPKAVAKEKERQEVISEEAMWVSVGERKAQRSRKSDKVGYKSAHIQTLGEKIKDGDKVLIVLDEPMMVGDELFPEDSELFGSISFQKKRGVIKISKILNGATATHCNIDVYDTDGYLGIALDINVEQEIASDVIDEGISQGVSYGSQASRVAAAMVGSAAKKIKNEPYVKIENKRKIYLSVNWL